MNRRWSSITLKSLVALLLTAGAAQAEKSIVLPRAGQVGLSVQVQGGSLLTPGDLGVEFGSGAGLSVRVRYRMRFERAIGLTFDTQRLSARNAAGNAQNPNSAFDTLGHTLPGLSCLAMLRDLVEAAVLALSTEQIVS